MDGGTDYEKAVSRIGSAAAGPEHGPVAIDLEGVFANKMSIKRIDYAEVGGLLEAIEAKKAEEGGQPAPKQKVQEGMAIGRRIAEIGISDAEAELGRVAGFLGKEFGKAEGNASVARAADELRRAVKSVEKEFGEAIKRDAGKAGGKGLVMPRLSPQDQLSELEQIGAGLDSGTFSGEQVKTIIDEISGMDAAAAKEDTGAMSGELKGLVALRNQKIKDIKGKLNIK